MGSGSADWEGYLWASCSMSLKPRSVSLWSGVVFAVTDGGDVEEEREGFSNVSLSRQGLGDFTFVLVHNLSELGLIPFFQQPSPLFQPQLYPQL